MCCQRFHEITPLKLTNFAGSEYLINGDYFYDSSFQIAVSEVAYNTYKMIWNPCEDYDVTDLGGFMVHTGEKCSLFRHVISLGRERGP